ncbi:MAG: 23S rRNA (guanosine(2251)-2'-O)-methyltransferase RlmB [Deltaproteobacteria bacterium]|nr:23S rRNA (guanosine(2251)-2'-O)-methyltransferase RlmB [Deltaproteobacteria bacterium]
MKAKDQLEGRNLIIEVINRKRRKILNLFMDKSVRRDKKIEQIVSFAQTRNIPLQAVHRKKLDEMSIGGVHNGVIAYAQPLPEVHMDTLIDASFASPEPAFFLLADELNYEHNLGAILRSAAGAGVQGVVIPRKRGKGLTPVVQRVAMGGAEIVPVVREGISSALSKIKKAGIRVIGADMNGQSLFETDLRGPIAIVMGGESKGLSPTLQKKCDAVVSIPLCNNLESLNVSVSAAILLYEKRRQEDA